MPFFFFCIFSPHSLSLRDRDLVLLPQRPRSYLAGGAPLPDGHASSPGSRAPSPSGRRAAHPCPLAMPLPRQAPHLTLVAALPPLAGSTPLPSWLVCPGWPAHPDGRTSSGRTRALVAERPGRRALAAVPTSACLRAHEPRRGQSGVSSSLGFT
jgi:hypothetical protein